MARIVIILYAILSVSLTCVAETAASKLKLAHIFQDNMVLQCDAKVPVWGWADAGEKVTVNFAGQTKTATAGKDSYWRVNLDPLKASSEGRTLIASCGENKIECKDILVGEVWLCAGQSNMAWVVGRFTKLYPPLKARLGEKDFPLVRSIVYPHYASAEPLKKINPAVQGGAKWQAFTSENAEENMAIPFFFARKLYRELKVPIGLVQVAKGATPQTAWCPREVIDEVAKATGSDKTYDFFFQRAEKYLPRFRPKIKSWKHYEELNAKWQKDRKGRYPDSGNSHPCVMFNGQIHPFAPFAFRGVIWHQGESGPDWEHAERMVANIKYWRKLFEHDFVYIWGGLGRHTTVAPPLTPTIRRGRNDRNRHFLKAQRMFGNDGKSVFCDLCDLGNFNTHFGEKDKAGERFALAALDCAYKKPHAFTGPQLIKTEVKPGEIKLKFTRVGDGLVYKPSIDGISGFVLMTGNNLIWIEPTKMEKDTLVFKNDKISKKSRICYGYAMNPHETLLNKEGFPASVFPIEVVRVRRSKSKDTAELIKFVDKPERGLYLNVTHVRRNLYIFSVVCTRDGFAPSKPTKPVVKVRIHIPKEWNGVVVQHDGQPVPLSEITTDTQGMRTAELDVKVNDEPYIIFNKAKKDEALRETDLTRF